ncbi:MAG TPA: ATP-binding protein [Acidimicrobiia bacterium]
MSLRTRLVISFTVLLLVVIAAVGLVASRSIEGILIDQIDRVLVGFVERGQILGQFIPRPDGEEGDEDFHRDIAEIVVGEDEEILVSRPSGFADEPDPLPDVSDLPDTERPVFLAAVDGSLRYRAVSVRLPEGMDLPGGVSLAEEITLVRATPLTDVEAASDGLIRTLALAGVGVLLLGGGATWWTVDHSMRPVEQMVETAEAIASGDLARRVPDPDDDTELGRLGHSLNEMLAHIEEAVETERSGRERLRQFIADASHELRTPLTAISGYAELRRKGGLDNEELEEKAWSRIESEGNRMGTLIEDLLMLTRLGQSQPLRIGNVDLVRVARDAAVDHQVIDPDRPISVTGVESAVIEADEERLLQVITSLLSNVRVHTPIGTTVAINVSEEPDRVVIEVTDDGPGIPEKAIGHVFDRFYRADPSRSRRSGGSGLGLSIVEAIVKAHGGEVTASTAEGGGARITVSLPRISAT